MNKLAIMLGVCGALSAITAFAQDDADQQLAQQEVIQQDKHKDKLEVTGEIGVVSAYVSRGGTNSPENDQAAIQASINASYNGFYAGYWTSKLGYSFADIQKKDAIQANSNLTEAQKTEAIGKVKTSSADYYEHDFILGYANKYNDLNYDFQVASYVYPGSDHSTGIEAGVFLSHPISKQIGNSFSVSLQSYLKDTIFMNQGDTYIQVGYEHPLPQGFKANLSSGFSWYQDNGKYEAGLKTKEDIVLRHATLQLSHDLLGNPKAKGWLKYVIGGENRSGDNQKNMVVAGMNYSF